MVSKRPIMQGDSDQAQLTKIYEICGSPNDHNMPDGWRNWGGCEGSYMIPNNPIPRGVIRKFSEWVVLPSLARFTEENLTLVLVTTSVYSNGKAFADLIDKLLTMDPHKRINAREALGHEYFWQLPLAMKPEE
jgi:serine/threonine-protein kinase BUR1